MCFYLLLSLSSFIALVNIIVQACNSSYQRRLSTSGIEPPPETSNEQNSIRIRVLFSLFLLIGALGRSLYFILDLINGFYENSTGIAYPIFPKSVIKAVEFLPTYFFGILFTVLLLTWCEKYYFLHVNSGKDDIVESAKRSIWWAERLFEGGILLYILLMIGDVVCCLFIQINEKGLVIPYLILKNINSTLLLIYMNITGLFFLYFGFKLFFILQRLSKLMLSDTIRQHRNKVLTITLIGGVILFVKSGIILFHVISMISRTGETPIDTMLWIVIPYHFVTEIFPLGFFQIYLWKNQEGHSNTTINNKEDDVLMPLYKKNIDL
jgi:hypothetical protein